MISPEPVEPFGPFVALTVTTDGRALLATNVASHAPGLALPLVESEHPAPRMAATVISANRMWSFLSDNTSCPFGDDRAQARRGVFSPVRRMSMLTMRIHTGNSSSTQRVSPRLTKSMQAQTIPEMLIQRAVVLVRRVIIA